MRGMSDRFDHRLERKLETKPEEGGDTVVEVRRLELIAGTGRRRTWSVDEKTRVIVESLVPGAVVSEVARRHGLSPQQLFSWRREARQLFADGGKRTGAEMAEAHVPADAPRPVAEKAGEASRATPAFTPVVVVAPAASPPGSGAPPPDGGGKAGVIEIAIGEMIVRVVGRVDAGSLATVLEAIRRARA